MQNPFEHVEPISDTNFRLRCKRFMLTYRTHVPKGPLVDFIQRHNAAAVVVVAHETGDSQTPYDHSHVLVQLVDTPDIINCRWFDITNSQFGPGVDNEGIVIIHPHVQRIESNSHWDAALAYTGKEDPANRGYYDAYGARLRGKRGHKAAAEPLDIDAIMACDELADVYKLYPLPSQVLAAKAIFAAKSAPRRTARNRPYWEWQRDLATELDQSRTDTARSIRWFVDPVGHTGKSIFCQEYRDKSPKGSVLLMSSAGADKDLAFILADHVMKYGNKLRTVFVDLPRATLDNQVYTFFEAILNGEVTSVKYAGMNVSFDPVHLCVFANWYPRMDMTAMSLDRWDVRCAMGGYADGRPRYQHVPTPVAIERWRHQTENAACAFQERNIRRTDPFHSGGPPAKWAAPLLVGPAPQPQYLPDLVARQQQLGPVIREISPVSAGDESD